VQRVRGRATGRSTDVVVLGIGGSALGPIALRTALRPPQWNLLDDARAWRHARLHVLDNVDPANISALLGRLDLATQPVRGDLEVGWHRGDDGAVSRHPRLAERGLGEAGARERLVLVTDPEKGALRTIARAEGIAALEIPANVGGRFSVLTPSGSFPPR
jgi:glucose-6-phosphate isomerase